MKARTLSFYIVFAFSQTALAAENASLLRNAELRENPFNDARVVTRLPAKSQVSIRQRKGAWAQIQAGKSTGWVKVLMLITASAKKGDTGLAKANAIFTTRSTSSETTTGVKGFIEDKVEAYKKAAPDYPEMTALKNRDVGAHKAARTAAEANLAARRVDYLPDGEGASTR